MRDRAALPIPTPVRCFIALLAALAAGFLFPASLRAQETQPPAGDNGTLVIIIKETNGRGVDATLTAESASTLTRSTATDAITGIATLKDVKPETYTVRIATLVPYIYNGKELKPREEIVLNNVVVKAGETTTVNVSVSPIGPINLVETLLWIDPNEVSNVTIRDRAFISRNALGVGNYQSLSDQLRSVPGAVADSHSQLHFRGENSIASAYYVDGVLMPPLQAGRASQFFLPQIVDKATVRVGGIPARYGGGSAAIIELETEDPKNVRRLDYGVRLGTFDNRELYLTLGNSAPLKPGRRGRPVDPNAPRINYLFNLSQRYTSNALEPPQSSDQTAFNTGASEIAYGKFQLDMSPTKSAVALFNFSSGRTNIAQRTTGDSSQRDLDQRFRQKDNNSLVMFQFRNLMNNGMEAVYSLSSIKTTQTVINYGTQVAFGLPGSSPIEVIPTVLNDADIIQLQADITPKPLLNGIHNVRFGASYQNIDSTDSYFLQPQSQNALNQLTSIDPRLTANGQTNPLIADKSGSYIAAYAEDTFQLRNGMRFNVGLRIDSYNMSTDSQVVNVSSRSVNNVNKTEISPRINIAYLLPRTRKLSFLSKEPTILRVSYNRLFAVPGLNQGAVLPTQPGTFGNINANGIGPQVVDMYDISFERQLGKNKTLKLSLYTKDIKRVLGAEQFFTGLQTGSLAVVNLGDGLVDGAEIAFDLKPTTLKNGNTIAGFLVYANSGTAPDGRNQRNNYGILVGSPFYQFDQQDTLTLGGSYQLKNGSAFAASLYYGSGLLSSALNPAGNPVPSQGRDSITEMNVRYSTGPRFFGKRASAELSIENLFDSKGAFSNGGSFAGSRFQQGRRIVLGFSGKL